MLHFLTLTLRVPSHLVATLGLTAFPTTVNIFTINLGPYLDDVYSLP